MKNPSIGNPSFEPCKKKVRRTLLLEISQGKKKRPPCHKKEQEKSLLKQIPRL